MKRRPTRFNQGLMRFSRLAISHSVPISMTTKVPATTTNGTTRLRAGSMNCGRKAAKNRMALGLGIADKAPWLRYISGGTSQLRR